MDARLALASLLAAVLGHVHHHGDLAQDLARRAPLVVGDGLDDLGQGDELDDFTLPSPPARWLIPWHAPRNKDPHTTECVAWRWGMHTWMVLAMVALLGAPACEAADEPTAAGEDRGTEEADPPPLDFVVGLDSEAPAIPQILEAGRPELATACVDRPEASIRIFNPVEPGAFADVPCSSMLGGEVEENAVPAAEESGEPVGTAQHRWSPVGLACGLLTLGSGLWSTYALCPRARTHHDRRGCDYLTTGGFTGLGVLCMFI
ncbi:hypothetical protein [Sorangium cellulosum]|nr:hypothetical protein [Sorangium cellulosum]